MGQSTGPRTRVHAPARRVRVHGGWGVLVGSLTLQCQSRRMWQDPARSWRTPGRLSLCEMHAPTCHAHTHSTSTHDSTYVGHTLHERKTPAFPARGGGLRRGHPASPGPRPTHRMMSVYSRSLPLLSFHFLYITEASTLAGEKVLGSLRREMTLRRMVLGEAAGVGVGGPRPRGCLPGSLMPQAGPPPSTCPLRCARLLGRDMGGQPRPGPSSLRWSRPVPSLGHPAWRVGPLCHSFPLQPGEEESAPAAQGEHSTRGWKGCAPWGSRKEGGPQGHTDTATGVPETIPEGGWGRDGRKWRRGRQGRGLWREGAPTDAATPQGAATSRAHVPRAGLPDADCLT